MQTGRRFALETGSDTPSQNHLGDRPGNGSQGDSDRGLWMGSKGGSGAGFRRDWRTESERDLRTGSCGDCHFGLPADSRRDCQGELRRGLQRELQEDLQSGLRGDSYRDLRGELESET